MKKWISVICMIAALFCFSIPILGLETEKEMPPLIQLAAEENEGSSDNAPAPTTGSGPALIISKFSCGGDTVTAGKVFTLSYNLYNTSGKQAVQNVVIKVNGGETFALNRGSDTYYVEKIKAKGAIEHSDEFVSSSETLDGSYAITVTATYEYYEDGVKNNGSSEVKISVPVTQEERVNIISASIEGNGDTGSSSMGESGESMDTGDSTTTSAGESDTVGDAFPVYVGDEVSVSYNFINSGFSKMLNTELLLVNADTGDTLSKAYLGTINPSTQMNGSSYLKVTFLEPGAKSLKFLIQYEDSHLNKKTTEYAFKTTVEEVPPVSEEPTEETSQSGFLFFGIIIIVILIVLAVLIVLLVRRRRKKKLAADESLWDDEDDEDDEDEDYDDEDDEEDAVVETDLPADNEDETVK